MPERTHLDRPRSAAPPDAADRREVKRLFLAALELEPSEQVDFLRRECAGDSTLEAAAGDMLVAHRQAGNFLDRPALASSTAAQATSLPLDNGLLGRRIGPYNIDQTLGHGGMGEVYLATRSDEAFAKKVAIKTLSGWRPSPQQIQRFRTERQILADLEHPGIASLIDGGTTKDGVHYIIMEYVDGQPIDRYCESHRLSTRRCLELFRQVCGAVTFAHQNLVIHRDLKPANILVTTNGAVKLLDFGIAKLLDPGIAHHTVAATEPLQRLMTPAYASPEQARGNAVTTATDIYSLGVVLYQLLAGRVPHPPEAGRGLDEWLRAVCEAQPLKPSQAADTQPAGGRHRKLDSDLDILVMKALHKEPERRYASAEQLANDIDRFLTDRPILARPDNAAYRLRKFVRRNRLISAAIVMLVLSSAGMAWLSSAVIQQRDRAERQRLRAQRVADFTLDLFEGADPRAEQGGESSVREFLDRGAERILGSLEEEPELRATMMDMVGSMYYRLGLYDRAKPMLTEALDLRRAVLPLKSAELADSLDSLAELYRSVGEPETAEPLYRRALEIRRQLDPSGSSNMALSLNNFGMFQASRGDLESASTHIEEALALLRRQLGQEDPQVAVILGNLAGILHRRGELDRATRLFQEVLTIDLATLGEEHLDVALDRHNLGQVLAEQGDLEAAEPLTRAALERLLEALGPGHRHTQMLMQSHGVLLRRLGRLVEARSTLERADQLAAEGLGAWHPDRLVHLNSLAGVLLDLEEMAEAEARLRIAQALVDKAQQKVTATSLASFLHNRGRLLLATARPREAEPLLRQALELRRDRLAASHPALLANQRDLEACHRAQMPSVP